MNKLSMLRKKNKSNLISIAVLCFLLVVAVTLSGTLAFFSDKGKIEGTQIVTFGVVDLNTPTNGFVYTQGVDFNKLYPGTNFEVTGGIKSLSTGDFYIYMEPKMSLQKLVGGDWLDLGDIYMGEQDNNGDWSETSTKAFTFSSIDIIGTISKTGTEKLFSTYATNASSIGWGEQSGLALNEGGTEFATGLYVVNVNSAATFANGTAPINNASYEHTLEMKCDVEFDFDTPNVVFYTTDNTNYTELVLNNPENENNFRFNFSIEFRAMQQANMIGTTGNLPNVFSADESWATPVTAGTKDLKDVYDFLRIEPLFTGEYKQWNMKYDSDANGSLDADCWTMTSGILAPASAWKTYLGALTNVEVYIPGYYQVGGRYVQIEALSTKFFGNTNTSVDNPGDENNTYLKTVKFGTGIKNINNGDGEFLERGAFAYCTAMDSITFTKTMVGIGDYAFYGCSGLTNVIIPNSVTSVGNYAFSNCSSLTSITIGNSVTSVGEHAFADCSSLTSITIGSSVTSLGDFAFYGCSSLTSITIPNSVTSIGSCAFLSTGWWNAKTNNTVVYISNTNYKFLLGVKGTISGSYSIEAGTIQICSYAFEFRSGLTSITIPNSVTSIGDCAFSSCSGLTSIIIPDSVTSIGRGAFVYCTGLTSIIIPDGVTSIGSGAFSSTGWWDAKTNNTVVYINNANYKFLLGVKGTISGSYSIEAGTTQICSDAFSNCTGLTSITIPNSVTSIGDMAFYSCTGLTSITIPDSVTSIGYMAFFSCTGLASITIPNSVTSIGNMAFYSCTGLASITIPDSVTSLGSGAFNSCSGLTSVSVENSNTKYKSIGNCLIETASKILIMGCSTSVIPSDGSVTSIKNSAFNSCSGLTSITIPNNVTIIGEYAFYGCTGLTSITIPNSVTSIGNNVFYNCSALTSITIPNSVTSIGYMAFYRCGLTSITIPDSVTSIGKSAFQNCSGLTSINVDSNNPNYASQDGILYNKTKTSIIQVPKAISGNITIPNSVTSIGNNTFDGCSALTSITIPNSVTSIGNTAFRDCSGLTSITIPDSIISIGEYAFNGCSGLTSITLGNSVTSIGSGAFYSCTVLTSITIPNSVISIGGYAFYGCSGLTSATFDNTVGWKAGTESVVVTNTAQNATYLKSTYRNYTWTRS